MKQLLSLLSFWLLSGQLYGQGILKGTVKDAKTGETLIGVTVSIVGTYKGAATNIDGFYQIADVKPGDYTVRVSYVGYTEKLFNGIRIKDKDITSLDAALQELGTTLETVVVVGERNLIDLESGNSAVKISAQEIKEMNVRDVQEVVAMQAGVTQTPDGIQIRGGRVYETQFVVEGINATDKLSGSGFGIQVASGAVKEIQVITGGADAEYGASTSGVIITKIKEGGDRFEVTGGWQRDNVGVRVNEGANWNTDIVDMSMGGPVPFTNNKLKFFAAGNMNLNDTYTRARAPQSYSTLFNDRTFWAPRQDNTFSGTFKLSYRLSKSAQLSISNQHSITVNQNNRVLQIVGNDAIVTPGFQYFFSLDMDKANTYTHRSNLTAINFSKVFKERLSMEVTLGRLFVNLRADANGRPFRSATVDQVFDASSVVTDPINVFNPGGNSPIVFVFPGPGLSNNGGIASLWHDHYVQEYTIKTKFKYFSKSKIHFLSGGFELQPQEYQWIDVNRPWVGAPIRINDTLTTGLLTIGRSSDVWNVRPMEGAFFFDDEIRYKGIIAKLGFMYKFWAPGEYIDQAIQNPNAPIVDAVRENYLDKTTAFLPGVDQVYSRVFGGNSNLFGLRYKARLLPKINVSFPVTENNVLYFNYGHSMRIAHPRFIYQGLDPVFQDRSFLSNLGNPDIDPEVSVSYELGYKTQITKDIALTITAFYNDRFDYIVTRTIQLRDQTGQFTNRQFFINQDYARIRGIEINYNQRVAKWLRTFGNFSYQIATGKSNSAAESALQIREQGFVTASREQFLAWDRPFEFKAGVVLKPNEGSKIGPLNLEYFRVFFSSNFKSGLRYTPFRQNGVAPNGRPIYEVIPTEPFSRVGAPWYWSDLKISYDRKWKRSVITSFSLEIRNIFDNRNAQIVNPVTGRGYRDGDPLPFDERDPRFLDPQAGGAPPADPSRWLPPRQILLGINFQF